MRPLIQFSASTAHYNSTYEENTNLSKYLKSGTKLAQNHDDLMQKETEIGNTLKDISIIKPATGIGIMQSHVKKAQMMYQCLPCFGQYETLVKEQIKAVHI